MRYFIIFVFLGFNLTLNAQDYAVSSIPDGLVDNAYVVVRKNDVKVEFLRYNQFKSTSKIVLTILNEAGLGAAYQRVFYTKSDKINRFEAQLFDANGKLIRKLRKRDLKDVSAYDGFSLFIDTRIQYYDFNPTSYPFTVEYTIETTHSTTINLPTWVSVRDYNLSVEESTYSLENKTTIPIRKKENGFEYVDVTKSETDKTLFYSIKNFAAIEEEVMSPALNEITPRVYFSPNEFELEGVRGKMENWQEFGKWYYENLLKDKQDLTKKEKETILELVEGIEDPVDKIQILYEYLQSKTRYVNISVGIGGWEPFPASYVNSKSYGDCKALSNYMISLLETVGIDAFYTIVYSERGRKIGLKEDFPSLQGNHVIVNVPIGDEIIWLECTSQQTAFNYLGTSTDDRYALSISPDGGDIITTQKFPAEVNKKQIKAKGKIDIEGNLIADYSIETSGLYYQRYYPLDFMDSKDKEQNLLRVFSQLPNAKLQTFALENNRKEAIFNANLSLESKQYAKKVGRNLILSPISFEGLITRLKKDDQRKFPFEIRFGYTEETEFELTLPLGYKLNEEFKPLVHINEFGNYYLNVTQESPSQLKVNRILVVNEGKYPKEKYNEYVDFQRKISSMDNVKILLETF